MFPFFVQLFLIIISIIYLWFLTENEINRYRKGHIIYYASNAHQVIPLIIRLLPEYLIEGEQYSLVELGAGQAPIARGLAKSRVWKSVTAVEWARSLALLARMRSGRQVKIVRGSVFDYLIPAPAVVYCYLNPEIMERLYLSGAFKNCLVFSLTFEIASCLPDRVIKFNHWQSPLRVYDLR